MRFYALLLTFLLPAAGLYAQIDFEKGTFKEALAKAEAEDKLIFMDAYAVWCGPCKMMDREVFANAEVGDFYNEHFVNVKMDMEKGEGVVLAERYGVQAYPSLLFLNSQGELVHRGVGYHEAGAFEQLGRTANDPQANMAYLETQYTEGNREPEFLKKYTALKAADMDGSHTRIAKEYMATQDDWSTAENMEFIFEYTEDPSSDMFHYILDHREEFEQLIGEPAVRGKIANGAIQLAFGDLGDYGLEQAQKMLDRTYPPEEADQMKTILRMGYYERKGDMEKFAPEAVRFMESMLSEDDVSAVDLNNMAWTFYESVEDKAMLEKALAWAQKSVDLSKQYYNMDTLAALYYKLGKKKKARKAAEEAIEIAKAQGEDYSGTSELLELINQR